MSTAFPTALDAFTNPTTTSKLGDVGVVHSEQHANANDAIEALEAKVGINNSTDPNSLDYKATNLKGRLEGWNDLVTPVTVANGASAPGLANIRDGIFGYYFDANLMKECFTNFHMGHDYIPGSMVYPHVHWVANTASSGVVRWGVEYTMARRHDSTGQIAFPTSQTIYIEQAIGPNQQYIHFVNESPDGSGIPGTILEADSIIMCRFFRDGEHVNDTFPDAVFLLSVDLHYQSLTKTTPSRFPPFTA